MKSFLSLDTSTIVEILKGYSTNWYEEEDW